MGVESFLLMVPWTIFSMALRLNGKAAAIAIALGVIITVNVLTPTGNARDWIGIYPVEGLANSTEAVVEHYVSATSYMTPATALAEIYEAHLFANSSLALLATRLAVGTVSAQAPTPSLAQTTTSVSTSWYVSTTGS